MNHHRNTHLPRFAVFCLLFSGFLAGCDHATTTTSHAALPTVSMKIGSKIYSLEVAGNETTREYGLMNRTTMPADHGMLFVFPTDTTSGFWMKNTDIPLDILFLDKHGVVVSISTMKPHDETSTYAQAPYRYAIELNAGAAHDSAANAGDNLVVPPDADAALK